MALQHTSRDAAHSLTAGSATAASREGEPRPCIRVAALIDTATLSGPGRQLAALAREIRQHGVDITVVLFRRAGRPSSPLVRHLEEDGVSYVELAESGPLDVRLVARVASVLAGRSPDVVQTHSYRTTAIVWLLRLAGRRWPWVAFQHGATAQDRKVRFYHWLDRRLAARADRIVLMSAGRGEPWRGHAAKVRVIHNAVVPLASPTATSATSAVAGTRPVYGVVGRLSFEKGVDLFLHACAILRQRGRSFSVLVVGDGPERERLAALSRELALTHVVTFRPTTPDVRSIYAALDALVIPSRSEGLPNVLLEALAADVPVVSTAVGAVPEVLTSAMAGLVVPPGDAKSLADAMVRIADDGRTPAARAARRACVDRFSLAARARAHVTLYQELAGDRRGVAAGAGRS